MSISRQRIVRDHSSTVGGNQEWESDPDLVPLNSEYLGDEGAFALVPSDFLSSRAASVVRTNRSIVPIMPFTSSLRVHSSLLSNPSAEQRSNSRYLTSRPTLATRGTLEAIPHDSQHEMVHMEMDGGEQPGDDRGHEDAMPGLDPTPGERHTVDCYVRRLLMNKCKRPSG